MAAEVSGEITNLTKRAADLGAFQDGILKAKPRKMDLRAFQHGLLIGAGS